MKGSIEYLCDKYELGKPASIRVLPSNQNIVYKVTTTKGIYIVKYYQKETVKDQKLLETRKKQIKFSEYLDKKKIKVILPMKFKGAYFIYHEDNYFLVYPYGEYTTLNEKTLDQNKMRKMAQLLAKIHKNKSKIALNCHYRKIKINYRKELKRLNYVHYDLAMSLKRAMPALSKLTKNCNDNLAYAKKNLVINHNDFKLLNLLWYKHKIYLIDFDAVAKANPIASAMESAFSLSIKHRRVNQELYKTFVKSYFKDNKLKDTHYDRLMYVSMNGKLQWLEHLLSQCNKLNPKKCQETISLIEELTLFMDNFESMLKHYK